jgi:hypothetical protein
MAIEIVSFHINIMVMFHSFFVRLPEGMIMVIHCYIYHKP